MNGGGYYPVLNNPRTKKVHRLKQKVLKSNLPYNNRTNSKAKKLNQKSCKKWRKIIHHLVITNIPP